MHTQSMAHTGMTQNFWKISETPATRIMLKKFAANG